MIAKQIVRWLMGMALAGASIPTPASAQVEPRPAATVIAIPPLTTRSSGSAGREDIGIAWQATQLIESDLRSTSELFPLKPNQKDFYSYPEVTAPNFAKWRAAGVRALVTGFVETRSDGRLTVGCYIYDVVKARELARKGFVVDAGDWRRAAHRCSGLAYQATVGGRGIFDTRIAYVAETGAGAAKVRRVAVMDSDGSNHDYVTLGETLVLSPRLSPKGRNLAFVSFTGGTAHIRLFDLETKQETPLLPGNPLSFSPRFSPDGQRIAFTLVNNGNADIYVISATGGPPTRLTSSLGIDTAPSFSPDGRQIVFESDRSGSQQLYVMNADGSGQRRLSFGGGWYAAPDWSPDGDRIAYTYRTTGGRQIGVMRSDGSDARVLTRGPADDSPVWAASSREILFERTDGAARNGLLRIALDGGEPRPVSIPQPGSDPDWSGVIE